MQDRGNNFERAINTESLAHLGDPERWGGGATVEIPALQQVAIDRVVVSPQFVRAQCPDLVSRAWELISFWRIDGLDPVSDSATFELEVTAGSGQTTGHGFIALFPPSPIAAAASFWVNAPNEGTVHLSERIPACAIAVRSRLRLVSDGMAPDHVVRATCQVLIAPRSLL
jgi:hypothetical protein